MYAATIGYIRTAQANLAAASSGEDHKAAMIDAYPDWQEPSLIDFYPRALLAQPNAPAPSVSDTD